MTGAKTYFVTTAIDYVNSPPHIGTAYEKICADVIARFKRLEGEAVFFLMGNDEHSLNVYKEARAKNLDPQEYCDRMADRFKETWSKLDIAYDDFIRTTDDRHVVAVKEIFRRINERGDIYQGKYLIWGRTIQIRTRPPTPGIIYQYVSEAIALAGVKNTLHVQTYLLTEFWDAVKDAHPVMFTFIRDGIPIYDRGTFMPWKALLKMGKLKPTPEAIDMFMKRNLAIIT